MIAVWMIYSIAMSVLVVAAGLAVERLLVSLRRPTRWVWGAAVLLSVGLAANNWRMLNARAAGGSGSWTTVIGGAPSSSVVLADDRGAGGGAVAPRRSASPVRLTIARIVGTARQSLAFDPSRFDTLGTPLLVGWLATSVVALLYLAAAIIGMRRLTRGMPTRVIDGHHVLLSRDIGPALIGVLRARIVLPRWAAEMGETERRLVLAHESEHAAAGDPLLLVAGMTLAALQAWNVALWFVIARLRFSIESDCDARVLGKSGDARSYGRLLVRVHTQSAPIFAARLAFTGTTSKLESRIRRLLGAGRPRKLASAVLAAGCIVVVTASASFAPTPVRAFRANAVSSFAAPGARAPTVLSESQAPKTEPPQRIVAGPGPTAPSAQPESTGPSGLFPEPSASIPPSVQMEPSQGLGCGRQNEGFYGPTFAALKTVARERHPTLFDQVQTTATVIAFAVDGTSCKIERDTVITIPISGSYSANVLYSRAFPELPEHAPEIGLGDARDEKVPPIRGNPPLMILYAMTNVPRERASCTGVSISSNAICSIDGEIVIRVMDSVRVLIATENHLFMFTSAEALADITSRAIQRGHVEYADGAISVLSFSGSMPATLFSVRSGKTPRVGERAERRFDAGLGLSHYSLTPVPLDAINRLRVAPCPDADTPAGSCFEFEGKLIRFPR